MAQQGKEISLEQQVNFLKRIDFFHDFDDHELRQLLMVTTWLRLTKHTHVIREGDLERVFYILVKGTVEVVKSNPETGEAQHLTTIQTGDCFGEMSLVSETPRTADVITTGECYLLKVEPEIINTSNVFLQLKFYKRFCEILVGRLVEANRRAVGQEEQVAEPAPAEAAAASQAEERPQPAAPKPTGPETAPPTIKPLIESRLDELPPMPKAVGKLASSSMQRRIDALGGVAVNPEVVSYISSAMYGKEMNTRKLADIISLDPALSFRLMQVANSSFFRRTTPVLTVPHAMIIVGIDTIKKVVREAIELSGNRQVFGGFHSQLGQHFWRNSVVVGRIADLLKEVLRINIGPDVYLAGLLHRIGTLVLDELQPAFYPQFLRPGNDFGGRLLEAETEFVGTDHGQAGSLFAKKWGLPEPYWETMCYYRTPQKARHNQLLVALVHLAALFAAQQGIRFGDSVEVDRLPADSFAWILIQEQHQPFAKADIPSFVANFEAELGSNWHEIVRDL